MDSVQIFFKVYFGDKFSRHSSMLDPVSLGIVPTGFPPRLYLGSFKFNGGRDRKMVAVEVIKYLQTALVVYIS